MVGDTFLVGCKSPENIIFPEFNKENPDMLNEKYNNEVGIYSYGCGIDNGHCSWGHSESLYIILSPSKNPNELPAEALYIARFHLLYAYHDKEEYFHLQPDKDKEMLHILKTFNEYDLYSKRDEIYDVNKLKDCYMGLIKKD